MRLERLFPILVHVVIRALAVPNVGSSGVRRLLRVSDDYERLQPQTSLLESQAEVASEAAPEVFAITCFNTTQSDPRERLLHKRLTNADINLRTIPCWHGETVSYGTRMRAYRDIIASLPDDVPIIVLDSFDMLAFGDAREVSQRFKSFGVPLVVSCTVAMWPPASECPAMDVVEPQYATLAPLLTNINGDSQRCMFPCGGALMGYRSGFLKLYSLRDFDKSTDDQCWLQEVLNVWLKSGVDWKLDYRQNLFLEFQSLHMSRYQMVNGRFQIAPNQTLLDDGIFAAAASVDGDAGPLNSTSVEPLFVHFDGLHPNFEILQSFYDGIVPYFNGMLPWGTQPEPMRYFFDYNYTMPFSNDTFPWDRPSESDPIPEASVTGAFESEQNTSKEMPALISLQDASLLKIGYDEEQWLTGSEPSITSPVDRLRQTVGESAPSLIHLQGQSSLKIGFDEEQWIADSS